GDFLAFVHIQQSGWGHDFGNPLKTLVQGMFMSAGRSRIAAAAWFTGFTLALLAVFYRRIPHSHLLFCFISLFLPLVKGLGSMLRYTVVLFPVFILLAQLGKDRKVDAVLTIILCVLLGCFMIFWSVGDTLII
ncbi:MAG: hypothetical protein MUD15_08730, partial [Desulfobacterota bacterium]|nr:hypothetical protein [Thermodesulfobacteriota bacterium]